MKFTHPADRRTLFTRDAKFVASDPVSGKPAKLIGYPIIWDATSSDRGGYVVRLKKGSPKFETPTEAYYEHDSRLLLGTTANQSLIITQDDIGVRVEITVPDTQAGRDAFVLVRDRYVTGMSFAMVEAPWVVASYSSDGVQLVGIEGKSQIIEENGEKIVEVTSGFIVDEVTITSRPAFTQTSIVAAERDAQGKIIGAASYTHRIAHYGRLQQMKIEMYRPGEGWADRQAA